MNRVATMAFALCTASVFAQLDQGQIVANIADGSGAVVANATVAVIHEQTRLRHQVSSSADGRAVVPALPPGSYTLDVEATGFKKHTRTGIRVDAASRVSIDITLEVGSIAESVTVTASTVPIQRETALIGRTIESRQIADLALNGRNPLNLALMKAGVVGGNFNRFNPDSLGGNDFTINGSMATNNSITIDGVYSVRTRSGTATLGVFNVDSIRKYRC